MLTLLGSNDEFGNCAANADTIGFQVQEAFNAAVPGAAPFDPATDPAFAGRYLRSAATGHRELAVKLCKRSFCSKPRNWQTCLWSGCSMASEDRRMLVSTNGADISLVLKAKRDLDKWVVQKGIELGCDLGLVMEKMRW